MQPWYKDLLIPVRLLLLAALALLLALIFSGCTTLPVVVKPPPLVKPVICLQQAPAALQALPDNFTALDLDAQAHALLLAHVADGTSYTTLLTMLYSCQQWVEAQP